MKDNKDKKGFTGRDVIVVILCVIALAVLVLILKQNSDNKKLAKQQLADISEQIEQGEYELSIGSDNSSSAESLVINEVNQQGWIELYNGSTSVNLEGMSISLDGETVFTIDNELTIDKDSIVLLELGVKLEEGTSHVISLLDEEDNLVKAVLVPALNNSQSYGCTSDGSIEMSCQMASKGESNNGNIILNNNEISFSIPGGFYSNAIELEINIPSGWKVYYTLDGSYPTTEDNLYNGSISISNRSGSNYSYAGKENNGYVPSSIYQGTVVRAIAVDSNNNIKQELSASYFIGIGDNSDIVDIPVISITTDPDNLFDYYEGMYVKGRKYDDVIASGSDGVGANYYEFWVKSGHIEYFEANKDKTFEGDVKFEISRDYGITSPQKGFKFYGDGAGAGTGLSQFYSEVTLEFDLLTNKYDNESKAREYLANALLEETSVGTAKLTPCTVFIDGEYWGLYMIRQPYDSNYFEKYYGITDEDVMIAKEGYIENYDYRTEYVDFYNQLILLDMTDEANYQWALDNMDMQNYIDYICANMYLSNYLYGQSGEYMWRTVSVGDGEYADGKWRWIIGELGCAMATSTASVYTSSTIDTFLLETLREDKMFRALLKNDSFRVQLKETMYKMADEIFTSDKVEAKLSEISSLIGKAATESYERFFANPKTDFYSSYIKAIQTFFDERGEYMAVYIEEIDELDSIYSQYEQQDIEEVEEEEVNQDEED